VVRTVAFVSLLFVGCGDDGKICGGDALHVCGSHVRDGEGRAVVLRGVNLAGAHKLAPYTDPFAPADYERLHTWGFRTLRFLIPWAAIEPTPGVYDDSYLDWVRERMQWAHAAGLDVVLDMHQDVYGEGFGFGGAPRWTCDESYYAAFVPRDNWLLNYSDANVLACYDHFWTDASVQSAYAAMWGHVAERLAGEPAIIGFDPMNEPHWGTYPVPMFERDRLQPSYARVITAVRAHAPWIVFAEPAASRNLGIASKLEPFTIPDVVYAPHMYDPTAELNGEFDAARRESLLAAATDLAADAQRLGIPLWIGEYGGIGTSPAIGAYMDAAYDGAASTFAGTMYWAFDRSDGYAILDPDGNEKPLLLDAIVRPYPARIAGEPLAWSYDETSRTLTVSWQPDAAITAPTVIITPARVYPNGVDVECGGCTALRSDGEVAISGGSSVTVTPRP
jgi:endoglycosylceramidase